MWKEIKTYADLPEYGTYVLAVGKDNSQYGVKRQHVVAMDDLEDGLDFRNNGEFFWLTENGTKIEEVTHWMPLPSYPDNI